MRQSLGVAPIWERASKYGSGGRRSWASLIRGRRRNPLERNDLQYAFCLAASRTQSRFYRSLQILPAFAYREAYRLPDGCASSLCRRLPPVTPPAAGYGVPLCASDDHGPSERRSVLLWPPHVVTAEIRLTAISCGIADALDQAPQSRRTALTSVAGKLDIAISELDKLAKFTAVFQQTLQQFEAELQRLGEQSIRETFLKPLARKILAFWRSIPQVVSDSFALETLPSELEAILSDFGVQLIKPNVGETFDACTMRPIVIARDQRFESPVVESLWLPGARHGEHVLEHAMVQIRDRRTEGDGDREKRSADAGSGAAGGSPIQASVDTHQQTPSDERKIHDRE